MQRATLKTSIILLLALTGINVGIYIYRDFFSYQPYEHYESLYSECDAQCANKWGQLTDRFTKSQLQEATQILSVNTSIDSFKTNVEKIKVIGAFIYEKFHKQFGQPSQTVLSLPPLDKYNHLSKFTNDSLWCADFASMFLLFASSQNILTRVIEIHGLHVINESYLPELKRWVLVDITNNTLAAISTEGEYLNAVAFKKSVDKNVSIFRFSSIGDSIKINRIDNNYSFVNQYFRSKADYYYYYSTNLADVYSLPEKIKRYLLPVSWHALYQNNETRSNLLFYVKVFFIFLEIVLFVTTILLGLKTFRGRSPSK